MKKSILVILVAIVGIPLLLSLLFIRTYTWYELESNDRINNEITTVSCFFDRDEQEISVDIVECDWYGRDLCVNGQKVVDGTLQVRPFLSENADTLEFIKKTEGSRVYRCPDHKKDCWTDELKIRLTYKFDSLNTPYDRQLLLTLVKNKRFGFSAH